MKTWKYYVVNYYRLANQGVSSEKTDGFKLPNAVVAQNHLQRHITSYEKLGYVTNQVTMYNKKTDVAVYLKIKKVLEEV